MAKATSVKTTRSHAHDVVSHTPKAPRAAHKQATPAPEAENGAEAVFTLSAKTSKLVEAVKAPFMAFADDFSGLQATRAALAPKFMKAFGAYQAEGGGSFISFVRYIDETVPADREGYRSNNVYQAADYLRRLTAQKDKPVKDPNAPEVASPIDVVTDLLVTLKQVVADMDEVWTLFANRYNWTEKRIARLQKAVNEARTPLLTKSGQERKLHVSAAA